MNFCDTSADAKRRVELPRLHALKLECALFSRQSYWLAAPEIFAALPFRLAVKPVSVVALAFTLVSFLGKQDRRCVETA